MMGMDSDGLRYALAVAIAFAIGAVIKQFLWWLDAKVPDLSKQGYWRLSLLRKPVARRASRKQGAVQDVADRPSDSRGTGNHP
jgi:hypothetical protein